MSSTIRTCAALERGVEVLEDPHHAGGLGRGAVGGDGHEVDLAVHVEVAHEVGEEEDGALEHADQQQVLAGVVARDLGRHLLDPVLELVGLDDDLADVLVAQHAARSLSVPGQAHALARGGPGAEALAGGDAGHPGDLAGRDHHGQLVAPLARDLAVGEEVLERAAAARGLPGARGAPRAPAPSAAASSGAVGGPLAGHAAGAEGHRAGHRQARRLREPAAARGRTAAARTRPRRAGRRRGRAWPCRRGRRARGSRRVRAPTDGSPAIACTVSRARAGGRAAIRSIEGSVSISESSTSASSRRISSVRRMLASAAGWIERSAGSSSLRIRLRA